MMLVAFLHFALALASGVAGFGSESETAGEICEATYRWENLTTAITLPGRKALLAPDQWFYVGYCKTQMEGRPCRLVPKRHLTECWTRMGATVAVAWDGKSIASRQFVHIRIPIGCNCIVKKSRPFPSQLAQDIFFN